MRRVKKLLVLTIGMILLWGSLLSVKASSFQFDIILEEKQIKPGDTIRIDMQVSNIDAIDGINVVEADLEYDETVFESVTFVDSNRWSITYNNEVSDLKGKFVASKLVEGVTEQEKIGQIQLKLKNDAKEQETEIRINHITSNDGTEFMDEGSRIIKVKIKEIPNNGQNGLQTGGSTGGQNGSYNPIQIIRGNDNGVRIEI